MTPEQIVAIDPEVAAYDALLLRNLPTCLDCPIARLARVDATDRNPWLPRTMELLTTWWQAAAC